MCHAADRPQGGVVHAGAQPSAAAQRAPLGEEGVDVQVGERERRRRAERGVHPRDRDLVAGRAGVAALPLPGVSTNHIGPPAAALCMRAGARVKLLRPPARDA